MRRMSLRHALIGLLREGPASGYDLMRVLTLVWPASKSQVYTELTRLTEAGLLVVAAPGPRGRKEYAPTEAGLAELRRWLLASAPPAPPRGELMLRVFLLGAVTRDQARDYLAWVRERAVEHMAIPATADEDVYAALVLEYDKRLAELTRDWTDWATRQIPP